MGNRRQSLNSVYITLGISVILVLIAALVGPFFVDWTVYRSTFETYAERALGHRVTVLGEADLRLLPAPSISFSDVRVGEAEDPLLVVSQFDMRVELPPLLKGEIRVLDMVLDRPHLSLSLDEGGRLDWLTAMASDGALAKIAPEDLAFENVTIRDGALTIVDARSGETHSIDDGNLVVSARSLAGPFKATGSLTVDNAAYSVSLATGRSQENVGIRIKGEVTPKVQPVNFGFDGMLKQTDAAPAFEGDFRIASIQVDEAETAGWSAEGQFTADIAEVAIPQFEFRFGPEDKRFTMLGDADLVYAGAKRFEVRATSKQIDLDRLLGGGPQSPVAVEEAGEKLVSALRSVPLPAIDGALSLDVPAVVAGGGIIQGVKLDLETMLGGWRVARLAGRLPGRTTVATQGDLGLEPALTYRGAVSIKSDQPGSFIGWWRQTGSSASTIDPVSVEGRLNLVPEGAALDNLRVTLAGASALGALSYRKPRNGNPEFSLNLNADRLDLDQIERLAALMRPQEAAADTAPETESLDVSVRLRADQVVARGVEGSGLAFEAAYSNGGVRIDRLLADNLAGARLDVTGEVSNIFTAPDGGVTGTLDATDLSGLVALMGGLFPDSAILKRLEMAADSLVPAEFDAELRAAAISDGTDLTLELEGSAGGSEATVSAGLQGRVDGWQDADIDLSLGLAGPDSGKLLQQLGLEIVPVTGSGFGSLIASAKGVPSEGLAVTLQTDFGTTGLSAGGTMTFKPDMPSEFSFAVDGKTDDLVPLALMAGKVLPVMTGSIPAQMSMNVSGVGSEITIDDAKGVIGDTSFEGRLEGDLEPAPGERNRRMSGEIVLSEAALRSMSEFVLGPDQWFSAGDGSSLWPSAAFGVPLLDGFDLTFDFEAGRLLVDDTAFISNPKAVLRLTPTQLRLDGLSGAYAGGGLEGSLAIRRSDAEAAVSGRLKLDGADLRQLVWRPGDRAVAEGSMDLFLEFDGAGRSISAIVTGLNGGGTFALRDGNFRGLNPRAFTLVTRAVDAGLELRDEKISELFISRMAADNLTFERVDGTLTLVGGLLSARNVVVDSESAEIFGSAEMDLGTYELDADFSLKVDPGDDAVTGAEPQVGLLFEGPFDAPVRRVDIAPFSAFLTLRAFEQEVERVEKLQAEILERDRLMRELKRQREAGERRARLAVEAAEAERLRLEGGAADPAEQGAETDAQPAQEQSRTGETGGEPAPQQQTIVAPAAPFEDQIRAVLGDPQPGLLPNAQTSIPFDQPTNSLPPLEPPVTIDDLLSREAGSPLVLPGAVR